MNYFNKTLLILLLIFISSKIFGQIKDKTIKEILNTETVSQNPVSFIENRGQISDQNFKSQTDILFAGAVKGVSFFLRENGISYQFNRIDTWEDRQDLKTKLKYKIPRQISMYRIDLKWIGANLNNKIETGGSINGYNNYYLQNCPDGIYGVKTFKDVTYKNLYNGIDLHYYEKNGNLKYDYIINSARNYEQIKIKVEGVERIEIQKDGSIILQTEFGQIKEDAPYAEQAGQQIDAKWIVNGNVLCFELGNYNANLPIILDPLIRIFGTYYGGNSMDIGWGCAKDSQGNVFLTGTSLSNDNLTIATSGSHKSAFTGYWTDAFLVKFNNNGIRQWGTFYGGVAEEVSHSCAIDRQGNAYICGNASPDPGTVVATPGSHQPINAGGVYDAYLAKFNSNGVRKWATYYGGASEEIAYCCAVDTIGNVFMTGFTSSGTGIASPNCQQNFMAGNYDAFLVKFDSSGVRDWGTYCGSTMMEQGEACKTDLAGNVYLAGYSGSPTSNLIATANSHQPTSGGNFDAFLIKYNNQGIRQWGTYYGGLGMDGAMDCTTDSIGNVYFCGFTTSSNSISTSGSHQLNYGGGSSWGDAFITKFNSSGTRIWGSYYGGSGEDWSAGCSVENNGNVYLTGTTNSDSINVISTSGSCQMTFGGGISDAFVAAFNINGQRISGTYYGASGRDEGTGCIINAAQSIFTSGVTDSNSNDTIATAGSHQPVCGCGQFDGFLVKFNMCERFPAISVMISDSVICEGEIAMLNALGASSYSWNTGWTSSSMSVSPTVNTSYTVFGKDYEGCQDTASISLAVSPCTSLDFLNAELEEIRIFPIPSQDHALYISRFNEEPVVIRVINTLGANVFTGLINVREYKLDLSLQSTGIYFIEISGTQRTTRKIVLN